MKLITIITITTITTITIIKLLTIMIRIKGFKISTRITRIIYFFRCPFFYTIINLKCFMFYYALTAQSFVKPCKHLFPFLHRNSINYSLNNYLKNYLKNYPLVFKRHFGKSTISNSKSYTMDYINKKLLENSIPKLTTLKQFACKNPKLNWYKGDPLVKMLGGIGDMANFDYSIESLLDICDFNNNVKALEKIFYNFNKFNSYSIAFLARNPRDNSIISLGGHFLVNNTTSCQELLYEVYRKIDELSMRYEIYFSDKITVKIRPINFKVKDPVFKGGRIRNTPSLPSDINLDINYKLLSSNYIPHTMNLNLYGYLVSKQDNVL